MVELPHSDGELLDFPDIWVDTKPNIKPCEKKEKEAVLHSLGVT